MIAAVRSVVGVTSSRFTDQEILKVCGYVRARGGDVGIVVDALLMIPRPSWLDNLMGYPLEAQRPL